MKLSAKISKDWLEIIETETKKSYFQEINKKINDDINS